MKIIGLSGSLRTGSYNTALLNAAKILAPKGVEIDIRTPEGIPLYNGDLEKSEGIPKVVSSLKDEISNADGLLISTPEYNHSVPGVLKNTIDWLSRPPKDIKQVFGELPVAMIGATPGGFGTLLSQEAWLPILRELGTNVWFGGRILVSHADEVFNKAGTIVDPSVKAKLDAFISGFVDFIESQSQKDISRMAVRSRTTL